MALVNYGSSDEDSDEDHNHLTDVIKSNSSEKEDKFTSLADKSRADKQMSPNIFSRLPAPKSLSTQSTPQNSSLNDLIVNKSTSGPIKISVPSLKAYSEEDNEDLEKERQSKRFKGSTKGTGLSSILPKPKNAITSKSSSLIPQSLLRPKVKSSSVKKHLPKNKTIEEESDGVNVNYFFNEENIEDLMPKELPLSDVEYGPKPDFNTNINIETSSSICAGPSVPPSVDDITYKKLIASKFGEEAPEQINIVDIDVSKHLSESKDWLKTISEEKEEEYTGVQPSSTARRKHQITYLALQAKQREVELKNEWARSRTTKTMSRAKYGF